MRRPLRWGLRCGSRFISIVSCNGKDASHVHVWSNGRSMRRSVGARPPRGTFESMPALRPHRSTTQSSAVVERPWLDPNAKPQIVIEGVGKSYDGCVAVDNVSLKIFKGEM